jgi:hypothetical protein
MKGGCLFSETSLLMPLVHEVFVSAQATLATRRGLDRALASQIDTAFLDYEQATHGDLEEYAAAQAEAIGVTDEDFSIYLEPTSPCPVPAQGWLGLRTAAELHAARSPTRTWSSA